MRDGSFNVPMTLPKCGLDGIIGVLGKYLADLHHSN
jgi:hypothetical protein